MTMSTYLVAFIVGPLEVTEPVDVAGTPLRSSCPPGKLHLTAFGLEVAEFSLRYLADYFDIPYPGDSMDLVAIPDFAFGAMENLGCVTFRETLLLVDPSTATQGELQNVVDVIAHELAHMWFGDLVTMKWWNGIWLNEAFATFMELKVTDAFRPEWERWVSFGLAAPPAFDTDALQTRADRVPVVSPADAEGMFDVLTYEKGAAVVRMLEQYLGEDEFGPASASTWPTTSTATPRPPTCGTPSRRPPGSRSAGSWTPGSSRAATRSSASTPLERGQLRLPPGAVPVPARRRRRHAVGDPAGLRYALESGEVVCTTALLDGDEFLLDPSPVRWVVANADGHGFYRVRVGGAARGLVGQAQAVLSDVERYGLVDDTWASVLAGTTAEEYLALADGFEWRDRRLSVAPPAGRPGPDRSAHPGRRGREASPCAPRSWSPALDRLGWEERPDDGDRDRELRGALITPLSPTSVLRTSSDWDSSGSSLQRSCRTAG